MASRKSKYIGRYILSISYFSSNHYDFGDPQVPLAVTHAVIINNIVSRCRSVIRKTGLTVYTQPSRYLRAAHRLRIPFTI